jgi:miniconductance mechanosensitive channel
MTETLHALLRDPWMRSLAGVLLLLLLALLCGVVARAVLLRLMRGIVQRTAWRWDDALYQHGVFQWLARMVPVLVVQLGIDAVPDLSAHAVHVATRLASALMVVYGVVATSVALDAMEELYRSSPGGSQRSIKGLLQLIKIGLYIVAALVIIAWLTDKRVGLLLSGLGALSAVLMLIFKDTILGFVAGLQLTANDMLRVGDWITMSAAGADGSVLDITLYSVKVRNFDNTIVTIPTWKLVSDSFQNWRGMSESGGRRIKRALYLDAYAIGFLAPEQATAWAKYPGVADYLASRETANTDQPTNAGAFRHYVQAYLDRHPQVHHQLPCVVRQLGGSTLGLPLELWFFTATTEWVSYERIQCDIFDALTAMLPAFGLRLFQQPSGYDARAAAPSFSGMA